mmetsp:Transcript_3461/g.5109  ORF Transcript_3461/g.5109 Transcript_3461/m.5109 type:complete len:159 (-) Transcript_3461:100-576(-)
MTNVEDTKSAKSRLKQSEFTELEKQVEQELLQEKVSIDELLPTIDKDDLKVRSVMSSIAGADSSQFHQYRNVKEKEQKRLAQMDADWRQKVKRIAFERRQQQRKQQDEERTQKKSREKKKKKKAKEKEKITRHYFNCTKINKFNHSVRECQEKTKKRR